MQQDNFDPENPLPLSAALLPLHHRQEPRQPGAGFYRPGALGDADPAGPGRLRRDRRRAEADLHRPQGPTGQPGFLCQSGATNHNIVCCATTGSGKSFLVNFLAFNYYACGALVRIIDIGGSYKKIANMLGARYLDFQPGTTVCLNPFTSIQEPDEELKSVTAVFAQMAYSNSDTDKCDDTELNLIRNAVRWAWQQKGQEADCRYGL